MITDLLEGGLGAGRKLLDALTAEPAARGRAFVAQLGARTGCGCDIPEPCWMPVQLGDVRSEVCRGGAATLRFRVTNRGPGRQTVAVSWVVESKSDGVVSTNDSSVTLGPFERQVLEVTARPDGGPLVLLVWVRGCRSYVVRWTVRESRRGCDSFHEVDIDDGPDLRHHWYDHFYCQRGCMSQPIHR